MNLQIILTAIGRCSAFINWFDWSKQTNSWFENKQSAFEIDKLWSLAIEY